MKRLLPCALLLTACATAPPSAFDREVDVLGVRVLATPGSSDAKLLHAAAVLAEYLDNDEDGVADDPRVLAELVERNAMLLFFRDFDEVDRFDFDALPDDVGVGQDLWASETHPGGAARGVFDVALEECLHLVTHGGYAQAYPDVFGEHPGTQLARAMDKARGGHFESVPDRYPDGAWYTYDDRTCEYECQVAEYVYWALTSILGGQDFPGRLDEIGHEWRLNTRAKVERGDPDVYRLLTDPRYAWPRELPDGSYRGRNLFIREINSQPIEENGP